MYVYQHTYTVEIEWSDFNCSIIAFMKTLFQPPEVLQMIHRCSWFEETDVFLKSCAQIEFLLIESYLEFIFGELEYLK